MTVPTRAYAALFAFSLLATLPAAAAADTELWTELPGKKRKEIRIPSVAPLVERVEPASLVVMTEGPPAAASGEGLPPGHPPFMPGPDGPMRGQGSGFLIHPSGYALTNHHVIENATSIKVRVGASREEVAAKVIGTDPKTDVALIKLETGSRWPAVPLGNSDRLKVGDFVVAIGNPFGLEQSVSMGILSARGRRDVNPSGRMGLYDFLQTDASINFGNSGGPLLNLSGEVVGMNTAINAAGQGIGFAIPINQIKRMLPQLKQHGRIIRSWIGVGIQGVTPELAKSLGLERPRGALVRQVLDNAPAAEAGVLAGDVILVFDGEQIDDANELPLIAGDAGVGRTVELQLVREGKRKKLRLTLGAHPDNLTEDDARPESEKSAPAATKEKGPIGLSVVTLDDDDRRRLDLGADQKGARVVKVAFNSAAFHSGLQPDDVVVKVNGASVTSARSLEKVVKDAKSGEVLTMFVLRGGSSIFVALQKP
jgi:serine protease Do